MLRGVPWALVQKMLADAPRYESAPEREGRSVSITAENAADIANYINNNM